MSRLLVALQFGLIALIALRVEPARIGPAFVVLLVAGLAVGAWALAANRPGNFNIRPDLKEGGTLVTHGPYRWVRHPMYLAVTVTMAAFCVAGDAIAVGNVVGASRGARGQGPPRGTRPRRCPSGVRRVSCAHEGDPALHSLTTGSNA